MMSVEAKLIDRLHRSIKAHQRQSEHLSDVLREAFIRVQQCAIEGCVNQGDIAETQELDLGGLGFKIGFWICLPHMDQILKAEDADIAEVDA